MDAELQAAQADSALHDASDPSHAAAVNNLASALSADTNAEPVMTDIVPNNSAGADRLDEMLAAGMEEVAVPSDYDFSRLELPDGEIVDAGELAEISEMAWACDIPQGLVSGLSAELSTTANRSDEEHGKAYRQTADSLAQKYGDKAEAAIKLAHAAVKSAGGQKAVDFLNNSGLGNSFPLLVHLIEFQKRKGAVL
jgi:hypothetical protein